VRLPPRQRGPQYRSQEISSMAYVLNALVAHVDVLNNMALPAVPLVQDLGLAPLDREFWRSLGGSAQPLLREWEARHAPDEDFDDPTERVRLIAKATASFAKLETLAKPFSTQFPIAYLESDYGREAVAAWSRSDLVVQLVATDGAINQALRRIGVAGGALDGEFTALGLGRFRSTEDWRVVASPHLDK
jgi:hypothetical protein